MDPSAILVAALSLDPTAVVVSLLGVGGAVGGLIALVKLPGERATAAIADVRSAAAEWKGLYETQLQQAEYWRGRAMAAERELEALRDAS